MENRQEKTALVLKYGKRRYDGGSEIELIRTIERQKAMKQLNELQKEHLAEVKADLAKVDEAKSTEAAANPKVPVPDPRAGSTSSRKKVLEALLLGPLEVCIGSVGMLTATLAIFTFKQLQNDQLVTQSQVVFSDCWKTLRKGIVDSLTTPTRLLKAVS